MVNVTITVPQELKNEMDKYSEVSWSEICRTAISQYITQRENPQPLLDVEPKLKKIYTHDVDTGYATLIIDLRILNRMNLPINVDRVLATVKARTDDGKFVGLGQVNDLHRKTIDKNGIGLASLILPFPKEKLLEFQGRFTRTFDCYIDCSVYVDGFKDAYWKEFVIKIAIDVWNDMIEKGLKRGQGNITSA